MIPPVISCTICHNRPSSYIFRHCPTSSFVARHSRLLPLTVWIITHCALQSIIIANIMSGTISRHPTQFITCVYVTSLNLFYSPIWLTHTLTAQKIDFTLKHSVFTLWSSRARLPWPYVLNKGIWNILRMNSRYLLGSSKCSQVRVAQNIVGGTLCSDPPTFVIFSNSDAASSRCSSRKPTGVRGLRDGCWTPTFRMTIRKSLFALGSDSHLRVSCKKQYWLQLKVKKQV